MLVSCHLLANTQLLPHHLFTQAPQITRKAPKPVRNMRAFVHSAIRDLANNVKLLDQRIRDFHIDVVLEPITTDYHFSILKRSSVG